MGTEGNKNRHFISKVVYTHESVINEGEILVIFSFKFSPSIHYTLSIQNANVNYLNKQASQLGNKKTNQQSNRKSGGQAK